MKSIEVKGTARTIAERSSEQARALKAIRKDNGVPCVLYGAGENVHFTVPAEGLRNLVYTPHIYVVDLIIDGKKVNAILKDIQFHPVKDTILHVDFYQIDETKPIVMEVPVQMEGLAEEMCIRDRAYTICIILRRIRTLFIITKVNTGVLTRCKSRYF